MAKAAKATTTPVPRAEDDEPDYAVLVADNSNDAADILAGDHVLCKTLKRFDPADLDKQFVHVQRVRRQKGRPELIEDTVRRAALQPDGTLQLGFETTDKSRVLPAVAYPSDEKGVRVDIVGLCLQRSRKLR